MKPELFWSGRRGVSNEPRLRATAGAKPYLLFDHEIDEALRIPGPHFQK